jgi:hypothetical protein
MKGGNVRSALGHMCKEFRNDRIQLDHTVGKRYIQKSRKTASRTIRFATGLVQKKIRAAHAKEKQRI